MGSIILLLLITLSFILAVVFYPATFKIKLLKISIYFMKFYKFLLFIINVVITVISFTFGGHYMPFYLIEDYIMNDSFLGLSLDLDKNVLHSTTDGGTGEGSQQYGSESSELFNSELFERILRLRSAKRSFETNLINIQNSLEDFVGRPEEYESSTMTMQWYQSLIQETETNLLSLERQLNQTSLAQLNQLTPSEEREILENIDNETQRRVSTFRSRSQLPELFPRDRNNNSNNRHDLRNLRDEDE